MRPEKTSIIGEIKGMLESSEYLLLVSYRGLTVEQLSDLRKKLRDDRALMHVVKNAYLGVAARQAGREQISKFVDGPTAVVYGGEVTQAAKILRDFVKDNNLLKVRGGLLGKTELSPADVEAMADIPPREVMLGMMVGTIAAPMSRLAGVMRQKIASLIYALAAVEEKKKGK